MTNVKICFILLGTKSRVKKKRAAPKKRKKQEESSDSEEFDDALLDDGDLDEEKEEGEIEKEEEEQNEMIEEILEFMQDANIGKGPVSVESVENLTFSVEGGPSEENSQDLPSTSFGVS